MLLGRAFETGARIALCRRDATGFAERAGHCRDHFATHRNPALAGVHAKLMRAGVRAGVSVRGAEAALAMGDDPLAFAMRTLSSLGSDAEFYGQALALVVEAAGAAGGYLYARTSDGLRCVAASGAVEHGDIDAYAARWYARAMRDDTLTASTGSLDGDASVAGGDPALVPCALSRYRGRERSVEGLVLLIGARRSSPTLQGAELEQLATLMNERAGAPVA